MDASHKEFHSRVRKIERKSKAMEDGYHARIRKDGLIEMRPDGRPLRRLVPIRSLLALLAAAIGYKVFLLIRMGEAAYAARLDALADGSLASRIGGTLMQIDPLTRMMTDLVVPYL